MMIIINEIKQDFTLVKYIPLKL